MIYHLNISLSNSVIAPETTNIFLKQPDSSLLGPLFLYVRAAVVTSLKFSTDYQAERDPLQLIPLDIIGCSQLFNSYDMV